MPQSSIRSGVVDLVLESEQIAKKLGSIVISTHTVVVVEERLAVLLSALQEIICRIGLHCKLDFSAYKEATIGCLIDRRLAALRIPNLEAYMEYITESTLMQKPGEFSQVMNDLKELGVKFSIDDFGTGYSSLAMLKQFPVNQLKIDRSFIIDIPHDRNDVAITRAIFAMGKSLNLDILAEGVETVDQEEYLKQMGCKFVQGFLYSRPVTAEAFEYLYKNKVHAEDYTE